MPAASMGCEIRTFSTGLPCSESGVASLLRTNLEFSSSGQPFISSIQVGGQICSIAFPMSCQPTTVAGTANFTLGWATPMVCQTIDDLFFGPYDPPVIMGGTGGRWAAASDLTIGTFISDDSPSPDDLVVYKHFIVRNNGTDASRPLLDASLTVHLKLSGIDVCTPIVLEFPGHTYTGGDYPSNAYKRVLVTEMWPTGATFPTSIEMEEVPLTMYP